MAGYVTITPTDQTALATYSAPPAGEDTDTITSASDGTSDSTGTRNNVTLSVTGTVTVSAMIASAYIEYSTDAGTSWTTLASQVGGTGSDSDTWSVALGTVDLDDLQVRARASASVLPDGSRAGLSTAEITGWEYTYLSGTIVIRID